MLSMHKINQVFSKKLSEGDIEAWNINTFFPKVATMIFDAFKNFMLSNTKLIEYANCRAVKSYSKVLEELLKEWENKKKSFTGYEYLNNKYLMENYEIFSELYKNFAEVGGKTQKLLDDTNSVCNVCFGIAKTFEGSAFDRLPPFIITKIFSYVEEIKLDVTVVPFHSDTELIGE